MSWSQKPLPVMESTTTWSAPTVTVPRSPSFKHLVCFRRPLADTLTSRVCPTHSPTKGFEDTADVVGAGVLAFVEVPPDVVADGQGRTTDHVPEPGNAQAGHQRREVLSSTVSSCTQGTEHDAR